MGRTCTLLLDALELVAVFLCLLLVVFTILDQVIVLLLLSKDFDIVSVLREVW